MTWAKLDDSFPEHLKVASLSDKVFRLHVTAICYAARNLTDGEIPSAQLVRLGGTAKLSQELVAAGLWEETDRGWAIHDYLEYNPSRADVDAERERKRLAGQAGGQARAKALAKAGAKAGAIPSATGNSGTPVPVPVPSASNEAEPAAGAAPDDAYRRICDAWLSKMGQTLNRRAAEELEAAALRTSEAWVFEAIDVTALANGKSPQHTLGVIGRWEREGRSAKPPLRVVGAQDAGVPTRFDFEAYEREQAELSEKARQRHESRRPRHGDFE